ncbi:MAG: FHA domain-containing protein, partial [Pseudomonadota bacterium]
MSTDRGKLIVQSPNGNERIYILSDGIVVLGRSAECDVVLRDLKVSRKHAQLNISEDGLALRDLGSRIGTEVDGVPVDQATLGPRSKIKIGGYTLKVQLPVDQAKAADPNAEEYIEIEVGKDEPSIVESVGPGEVTLTHDGLEQSMTDTSVPRLAIYEAGAAREMTISGDELVIGRDEDCDVVIQDGSSSRRHAALVRSGDRFVLKDLDSKNGTWVRSKRVEQRKLFNGTNFRIGDTFFVYKAPFRHEALTLVGNEKTNFEPTDRIPVVVLPGIMGSELVDSEGLFWPNMGRALRNPEKMAVGRDSDLRVGGISKKVVVVKGVIKLEAYSRLVDFLEEGLGYKTGKDLLQFAYDWRQDNRESAQKLKVAIDDWRENVIGKNTRFMILCHSMGALVSRYYLQCLGGAANVSKFVTMGGAHFGAPFVIQTLMYGPDLLPLGIGRKGLHAALMTMPSAYQLVPPYPFAYDKDGSVIDVHEDDSWVKKEFRHLLKSAKEFHREIGNKVNVPTTCIFGYGVKTATKLIVQKRDESGWKKLRLIFKNAGDNRVVDQYGFLPGADIHPVKQQHGSLWTDNDV